REYKTAAREYFRVVSRAEVGNARVVSILFFNDTAPPEIYTLPLHDALPILNDVRYAYRLRISVAEPGPPPVAAKVAANADSAVIMRRITTIAMGGRSSGKVMCTKRFHAVARSSRAAS